MAISHEQRHGAKAGRALWAFAFALAVASSPLLADSKADAYYQEAKDYLAKGDGRAAIIQLKNALQRDPAHRESRLLLGVLYLRSGDAAAAEKEFKRASELGADKERWQQGLGQALLMQHKYRELLDQLSVDDTLPAGFQATVLAMRAQALLASGDKDEAAETYQAAMALEPDNVMARLGRGTLLSQQGRFEEALADVTALLAAHPDNVEVLLRKAELHRQLRQLPQAEEGFGQVIERDAANVRARMGLGLVYIAEHKPDEALAVVAPLDKVAEKVPQIGYIHALAAYQKGDMDEAAERLQLVLRDAPDLLQAQLLYGIVNYAQGRYQLAEDYFARLNATLPGQLMVAKLLAATRMKLGQPDRAISVLTKFTEAYAEDPQLLALLGSAYLQAGDNSRGAEYMALAVELAPEQALLRTQLAVGQLVAGDTSSAISELEQAVNLGQDLVQADVLLVLSYIKAGEQQKALQAAEQLHQRMPDSPIPQNLIGLAYLAAKDYEHARQAFQAALALDADFLVAELNLARLAQTQGDRDGARQHYKRVLARQPGNQPGLMGMAALAEADGDLAAMEQWVKRAHEADPKALRPALVLADRLLKQGEALQAMHLLSGLSEADRQRPEVLRLQGMAQLQAGQFGSAVGTLQRLTRARPDYIEGWFQLGRAQVAAQDLTSARESFAQALSLDKQHRIPLLLMAAAELELKAKRWDDALGFAERLQQAAPERAEGQELAAAAYRGLGRAPEAISALERAMAIQGTTKRVQMLAHSYMAAGDFDKASQLLENWLSDHPEDRDVRYTQGLILQQQGKVDAAIRAYQLAMEEQASNPVILNNLAWLYLQKDAPDAEEYARKAYEIAPERAEIVDTYGWVMLQRGDHVQGLSLLQQALLLAPQNPEIGLHVAEALHLNGRDAEALPLVEQILRDHGNSKWGAPAQALRDRLKS